MNASMWGRKKGASGTTLVELIITIAAGAIVILGVYRLLMTSLASFNRQDQVTDMYMNATYSIKKLSEVIAQVGANLPDTGYAAVAPTSTSDITLRVNPYNAKQILTAAITSSPKIPVDSGNAFKGCDSIVVDTGYGVPITKQIDSVKTSSTPDTVYIKSPATITLKAGAIVYAANTSRYYLSNGNLCLNSDDNILAENIDSIAMVFRDSGYNSTTNWINMISASLYVRARTADPDQVYTNPTFQDHYRRLSLSMDLRLRNKF